MSTREIPQPIPPKNERIKTYSVDFLTRHNDEWCFERTHYTREFSVVLRKWMPKPELTRKEYVTLESQGIKKVQRLDVLIQRTAFDSHLREISKWFRITLECRVSNDVQYEHHYLKIVKPHQTKRKWCKGCFVLSDLAIGVGQILSWSHRWISRVGEEKIVTQKEASKLIEAGEIADIVEEDPKKPNQFNKRKCVFHKVL